MDASASPSSLQGISFGRQKVSCFSQVLGRARLLYGSVQEFRSSKVPQKSGTIMLSNDNEGRAKVEWKASRSFRGGGFKLQASLLCTSMNMFFAPACSFLHTTYFTHRDLISPYALLDNGGRSGGGLLCNAWSPQHPPTPAVHMAAILLSASCPICSPTMRLQSWS